jgi:hypothetical protein
MKLKRLIEFAVFVSLSAVTVISRAEEQSPATVTVIKRGEQAPNAGLLFSPQASAVLATQLATAQEACSNKVDRELSLCKENCSSESKLASTRCSADKSVLESRVNLLLKENDILKRDLASAASNNTNKYVLMGVGVLSGIGLTLLTTYVAARAID